MLRLAKVVAKLGTGGEHMSGAERLRHIEFSSDPIAASIIFVERSASRDGIGVGPVIGVGIVVPAQSHLASGGEVAVVGELGESARIDGAVLRISEDGTERSRGDDLG